MKSKILSVKQEKVYVDDWGSTVILREPTAIHWMAWQDGYKEDAPIAERIKADAVMLSKVLLDENSNRIISDEDVPELIESYSSIHSKLLHQAIALANPPTQEEAVKK